jgi:hypothetical protein
MIYNKIIMEFTQAIVGGKETLQHTRSDRSAGGHQILETSISTK